MTAKSSALARFLRALAALVERESIDDLEVITKKLMAPRSVKNRARKQNVRDNRADNVQQLHEIVDSLRQSSSRHQAENVLTRQRLAKHELEQIARVLDLPVSKQDNSEKLVAKIIEVAIGSRLSSEAIRGG